MENGVVSKLKDHQLKTNENTKQALCKTKAAILNF